MDSSLSPPFVSVSRYYQRFSSRLPRCTVKKQVPIFQMACESPPCSPHFILLTLYEAAMISDALLIFLPLQTLRELKNQQRLRRRLQLIFTASALTTCASIVSGAPPEATAPLPTTYRAGEEGPFSGAPPLPTACKYSTFFLSPVARSLPCHPIQFVGKKCSHAKIPLFVYSCV